MLRALAQQAQGEPALSAITQALEEGVPAGYVACS